MKNKYYGVYASNGLGIYTNYGKFLNDQKYMRSERIKSFKDREGAEDFAVEGFEGINGINCELKGLQNMSEMRLNYFYFQKKGAAL